MRTLLQIIATPHQDGSSPTRQLADAFLQGWQTVDPTGAVETIDLTQIELPPIDERWSSVLFGQPSASPPACSAVAGVPSTAGHAVHFGRRLPVRHADVELRPAAHPQALLRPRDSAGLDLLDGRTGAAGLLEGTAGHGGHHTRFRLRARFAAARNRIISSPTCAPCSASWESRTCRWWRWRG